MNIRSRSSRFRRAFCGSLVFPAISRSEPRLANAARRKPGVGQKPDRVAGHGEERLYQARQQPEALRYHAVSPPAPRRQAEQVVDDQAESLPRNQWNVSSMASGDRVTHRSSMSMAANSARNGLSAGVLRRP